MSPREALTAGLGIGLGIGVVVLYVLGQKFSTGVFRRLLDPWFDVLHKRKRKRLS